jgi:hypothetical protein
MTRHKRSCGAKANPIKTETKLKNHAARKVSRVENSLRQVPTIHGLKLITTRKTRRTQVRTIVPGANMTPVAIAVGIPYRQETHDN